MLRRTLPACPAFQREGVGIFKFFGENPNAGSAGAPCRAAFPLLFRGKTRRMTCKLIGIVARAYLYMDDAYSEYRMSRQQKRLMETWDHMYPPDAWELPPWASARAASNCSAS